MNEIAINYELAPKDFIKYSKIAARRQTSHQPLVIIFFLFFVLFICADVISAAISGSILNLDAGNIIKNLSFRFLLLSLIVGVVIFIIRLSQRRLGKRIAETEKNGIFCQHKIIINDSELIEATDVNLSRHYW